MNRNYLDEGCREQHFRQMTNKGKVPGTEMVMNQTKVNSVAKINRVDIAG